MKELLTSLLDNRTWGILSQNASLDRPLQVDPGDLWLEWRDPNITVFGCLVVFLVMKVLSLYSWEVSLGGLDARDEPVWVCPPPRAFALSLPPPRLRMQMGSS